MAKQSRNTHRQKNQGRETGFLRSFMNKISRQNHPNRIGITTPNVETGQVVRLPESAPAAKGIRTFRTGILRRSNMLNWVAIHVFMP